MARKKKNTYKKKKMLSEKEKEVSRSNRIYELGTKIQRNTATKVEIKEWKRLNNKDIPPPVNIHLTRIFKENQRKF